MYNLANIGGIKVEQNDVLKYIESIMFALGRKITLKELAMALDIDVDTVQKYIEILIDKYKDSGINIIKIQNCYQMVTAASSYEYVAKIMESNKKATLPPTCMEVLSIIAYNPNITKSEIENIRGTTCDSQVSRLLEYGLIEEKARLKLPGRPAAYGVTDEFLRCMRINKVEELPEFEKINSKDEELERYRQQNLFE